MQNKLKTIKTLETVYLHVQQLFCSLFVSKLNHVYPTFVSVWRKYNCAVAFELGQLILELSVPLILIWGTHSHEQHIKHPSKKQWILWWLWYFLCYFSKDVLREIEWLIVHLQLYIFYCQVILNPYWRYSLNLLYSSSNSSFTSWAGSIKQIHIKLN